MRSILLMSLLLFTALIAGCSQKTEKYPELSVNLPFDTFPKKYTCDGEDVSPPIEISGVGQKAKSLAIIMDDPDAPMGIFTHWVIWNIPANTSRLPEGIPPLEKVKELNAVQGKNDFGKIGYAGPCPPSGVHRYRVKVYALDTFLDLEPGSTKKDLEEAMKGHILQFGEATATYGRAKT